MNALVDAMEGGLRHIYGAMYRSHLSPWRIYHSLCGWLSASHFCTVQILEVKIRTLVRYVGVRIQEHKGVGLTQELQELLGRSNGIWATSGTVT